MHRFIIIDHSLQDLQGHHYECSVSIAEAAKRQGYLGIIIANKNFSSSLYPDDIQVISEFEVDWFNNSTKSLNSLQKNLKQFINEEENFSFINLVKNYQEKINYQISKVKLIQPKTRVFLEKVEGSLFRLSQWINDDIKLLKNIPLSHTFWGVLKIVWGLVRFVLKIIRKVINKIIKKLVFIKHKSFIESFNYVMTSLNLTEEDHVFIHTLSIEQLESILYFLQGQKLIKMPQYHIMLRRDIDDNLVKNAQGLGLKDCLTQFYQNQLFPQKVKFYTDTKQLVNRYNSLSPVKFIEIPVPFRQEKLELNNKEKINNKTIHLVYLGDARIEKGYLYLPSIIADLWQDYLVTKKVKVTIQSNFNINSGEKGILACRLQLEEYPEDIVKIIKNSMTTEEYYQLLMSADLLVIPYDIDSYKNRTSGVLTESLAAGKPVIVPDNSWLASQVDESRAGIYQHHQDISKTIIKVINNLNEYQKNAKKFSMNWKKKHSPDSLINCLLSDIDGNDNDSLSIDLTTERKNIININQQNQQKILLIIQGDNLLTLDTHGQVIISHLEYLSQLNCQIYLIIYSLNLIFDPENNNFTDKIKTILTNYDFQQTWFLKYENCPQFIDGLDKEKYFYNVYDNQISFTRNLIEVNSLVIPESLIIYLKNQNFNAIFLDTISNQILVEKIGLNHLPIICQVSYLQSYYYSIINDQEIEEEELKKEINLFSKVKVIMASYPHQAEKIVRENKDLRAYILPTFNDLKSSDSWQNYSKVNDFLWGNNKLKYQQIINDSFKFILGDKLNKDNPNERAKKIAILYPWGDILERKAGASQRVGLLIDYLQEKDNLVWLFTISEEKELIIDHVRYSFYEQNYDSLDLINKVYTNSYSSLINTQQLKNLNSDSGDKKYKEEENIRQIAEDWRLSMYNQFRFDDNFEKWIEKITDWADIVILEYPFWAKTVSKICQRKKVKLIITAHDILCQQVSQKNPIYQILLAEEISSLKMANYVVCVSKEDQEFLTKWDINSKIIPNPVHINLSLREKAINNKEKWFNLYPWLKENYCLFVGSGHFPNLEAVKEIKQIAFNYREKKFNNSCNFIIIGSCYQRENKDNIISLGKVDIELLTIVYQQAKLILAPMLSGTGSSLKIIEAMSFGKVILGTNIAFRGYDIHHQMEVIIEDNLNKYCEIIDQLLIDNELLGYIAKNAKNYAKNYEYRTLYNHYVNLIETI